MSIPETINSVLAQTQDLDAALAAAGCERHFLDLPGRSINRMVIRHPDGYYVWDARRAQALPECYETEDAAFIATMRLTNRRYDATALASDRQPPDRTPMRYRCEECGATLDRPYCPSCRDPEMIVEVRMGRPEPAPFGQDGLNEDHYGHG